jgi:NAD(P)-dependent dehydrogenase (short-subunit alcohol dehydrogenase family)
MRHYAIFEAENIRVYDINVTGVFISCQVQARVMLPRKKGSIINIASIR